MTDRLRDAIVALYTGHRWFTNTLPPSEQQKLWEELRDAAGIPVGTATTAGVAHDSQDPDWTEECTAGAPTIKFREPRGVDLIFREQRRQRELGYSESHDDLHEDNELGQAAAFYALSKEDRNPDMWPWGDGPKTREQDRVTELSKAGALIASEIDRIKRHETSAL